MNDISLSSSSTVIKKPKLSNDSVQTAASLWPRTNNNDLVGYDQDDDSYSQPLVSSLSRFLPLPSFSWKNNKSKPQSSSTNRKPAFVAKEVQLAKLRMSLASCSDHERCFVDICQCRNCRGDIISLWQIAIGHWYSHFPFKLFLFFFVSIFSSPTMFWTTVWFVKLSSDYASDSMPIKVLR